MKNWIRNLLIAGGVLALLLINITVARADLPPAIWHCASQDNCIALLRGTNIEIYRKGILKGTINQTGNGDGRIRAINGWLVFAHNDGYVYLYNVETGEQCNREVGVSCTEGIVLLHPTNPSQSHAYFACPDSNGWVRIPMDCSDSLQISSTSGPPISITVSEDRVYFLSSAGWISQIHPWDGTGGDAYIEDTTAKIIRYWNDGTSSPQLFMISENRITTKDTPPLDGNPAVFQQFAAGVNLSFLAVSNTHVLVSTNSDDVFLVPVDNPSGYVTFSVTDSHEVALSPDTAYVIEIGGQVVVKAFDMNGSFLYTIPQSAYDIAYIAPTLAPVCLNGLIEPGEVCDSTDFDGATCQDYGFDGGELACSASCDTIFTSGCWSCGDGVLNPGESCDGTNLGTASCTEAGYENGNVSCNTDCTVNYDQCYTCGNGLIEGAEQCEGADLSGATCQSEGFFDGSLTCGDDCMFDTSECSMCGDLIANNGETCDGTDTPGMICQTLGLGYTGGELACTSTCDDYDDSGCWTCGDGIVNANEECDGADLNGQDCNTLGLGSGTLSCFENCTFNLSQCSGAPTEYCGNGVVDNGEECDDGNRSNNDDCSEFCQIIPPTCGLGGVDAGESCDGTDLNGETCESLGYQTGVLYCGEDCQFRTDDCRFTNTQTMSIQLNTEPEPGELSEELNTQYETLKSTLTPRCVSQDINGDLVITTTPGSYCTVRARALNSEDGEKMFSFIYFPENALEDEAPVLRFYQNGNIAENFGGHITAYQGLQVRTVLVQDRLYNLTQEHFSSMGMKFLAVHPDTNSSGRWLAVDIGTGSTSLCTDTDICAHLVPQQGQVIINLDALEDINKIDWKPPKKNGGCSCSTGNNNSFPLPLILLVMAFLVLRNRRNREK